MIVDKIISAAQKAVIELYGSEAGVGSISVERTKREISGDYTLVVFPLLKISRKSPETTANELGGFLLREMDEIASFEVIKGFLNLTVKHSYWCAYLAQHLDNPVFGLVDIRDEAPVVVEFSSPNTNKPLHLGHIRNNLLGFSLSEILRANGHRVVRVNLVNDRGIHICKSMLAYMKWGDGETPGSSGLKGDHLIGKYYVLFDRKYKEEVAALMNGGMLQEEAEKRAPLMLEAQEILRKWEEREPSVIELWTLMNDWVYEGFEKTYQRLGISFEQTFYESKTYLLGKELVEEGLRLEVFQRKADGSVWVDLTSEGLDEKLLLRSDGTSVYMTQDLGTAEQRYHLFHPSEMIYVVGNEQNYHFDVLVRVLSKLNREYASKIHHLSYGMVELPHGRMKSREGTVVDADDLMDEMFSTAEKTTRELGKADELGKSEADTLFRTIGLGALKYYMLKVDPRKNMLFNPEESIDFNGNTGPFIQYTHARIYSLLRKASDTGIELKLQEPVESVELTGLETEVVKLIHEFPAVVRSAGLERSPAVIANYVFELAKIYNQFYQELPVMKEPDRLKQQYRLAMSRIVAYVIRRSMSLLGIDVPEKM